MRSRTNSGRNAAATVAETFLFPKPKPIESFSELSVDQAAPTADPDGDGQDNAFEFLAVLDPMDPESVFSLVFMDDPAVSDKLDTK